MDKLYIIIVTYEPIVEELYANINRLITGSDTVIVCNNSDDKISYDSEKVKIFNFGENLGIAEAQSIGMDWAFNNGADFVLQLDEDSTLSVNEIHKLIINYRNLVERGFNIGLIGPKPFDKDTKKVDEARVFKGRIIDKNIVSVSATLSSGSLIPKRAYLEIGGMDNGLFIDAVDFEYCWRLKAKGFMIVRCEDVFMAHKGGKGKRKFIGKYDFRIPSPIRHYYQSRNILLLCRRKYVPVNWKLINIFKIIVKLIVYPFIFKNFRKRYRFIFLGLKDGFLNKYGKLDLP